MAANTANKPRKIKTPSVVPDDDPSSENSLIKSWPRFYSEIDFLNRTSFSLGCCRGWSTLNTSNMPSIGGQWLWQEVVLSHPKRFNSRCHQSVSWALPVFSYEPYSWDTWLPFQHGREWRVLPAPHKVGLICSLPIAMLRKRLHWECKRCSLFISFDVRTSFIFLLGMMARGKGDKKGVS